jgi:lipopolysaccharide/colanic/teichoic acid biosynthesis glycosyltransferase
MLKFRTMRRDAELETGAVWSQAGDPRITALGRWLRRTRLDELPQVLNVLSGEMSLVGPRPERPHFVGLLAHQMPIYRVRHSVRPGLTGWAQIRYHYGNTEQDARAKLEYDLYYIKHASLALDLEIILQTAPVMLFGQGV